VSTSYLHLGSRWYAPATGAFTTQDTNAHLTDPANGNRYAYAADNPANNTDPTGNLSCADGVGGIFLIDATAAGFICRWSGRRHDWFLHRSCGDLGRRCCLRIKTHLQRLYCP
jgi:RHS repeat-associated protein